MNIKTTIFLTKNIFIRLFIKFYIRRKAKKYNVHEDIVDLVCDIMGDFRKNDFLVKTIKKVIDFIAKTDNISDMISDIKWDILIGDISKLVNWLNRRKAKKIESK